MQHIFGNGDNRVAVEAVEAVDAGASRHAAAIKSVCRRAPDMPRYRHSLSPLSGHPYRHSARVIVGPSDSRPTRSLHSHNPHIHQRSEMPKSTDSGRQNQPGSQAVTASCPHKHKHTLFRSKMIKYIHSYKMIIICVSAIEHKCLDDDDPLTTHALGVSSTTSAISN